jgi:acyl-coenzyme A thioesterase 13
LNTAEGRVGMDDTPDGFQPLVWPGFCALIGPLQARPEADGPGVVIGLRIKPRHANKGGYAHGGLVATLADIALTNSVLRRSGPDFLIVTCSINLDFIGAVETGEWLEAHTIVTKSEGSLAFAQCDLLVGSRKIVHASGVMKRVRLAVGPMDVTP